MARFWLVRSLLVAGLASGVVAGAALAQCGGASKPAAAEQASHKVHTAAYETMVPAQAGDIIDVASGNKDFSTLVTAIKAAGLVETLKGKGPFTVFAPTNAAFAKIDPKALDALLKDKAALTRVLTSHVVAGEVKAADVTKLAFADTVSGQRFAISTAGGVSIGNAKVTATDIAASNGVIHVIDTVIMPESKDVVGVAVANGSFKTLAKLLEAAGLVSTLQGDGPFTVFAPTDEAFAKLDKKVVADLLKPENKAQLAKILTYHVVPGRVFSDQALKAKTAKTVQGSTVEIALKDGKAKVNDSNLVKTDINASNGVIHVVDTVLMPK